MEFHRGEQILRFTKNPSFTRKPLAVTTNIAPSPACPAPLGPSSVAPSVASALAPAKTHRADPPCRESSVARNRDTIASAPTSSVAPSSARGPSVSTHTLSSPITENPQALKELLSRNVEKLRHSQRFEARRESQALGRSSDHLFGGGVVSDDPSKAVGMSKTRMAPGLKECTEEWSIFRKTSRPSSAHQTTYNFMYPEGGNPAAATGRGSARSDLTASIPTSGRATPRALGSNTNGSILNPAPAVQATARPVPRHLTSSGLCDEKVAQNKMEDDDVTGGLFGEEEVVDENPEIFYEDFTLEFPKEVRKTEKSKPTPTPDQQTVEEVPLDEAGNVKLQLWRSKKHHSLWGHMLWNGAQYYAKKILSGEFDVKMKSVLEVGSGLGVPSILSSWMGARCVVATDYPEEPVLALLRKNVEGNAIPPWKLGDAAEAGSTSTSKPPCCPVHVEGLLWGNKQDEEKVMQITGGTGGFEVLILSDVIFNHVCHHQLAATIQRCLAKERRAVAYVLFTHYRPRKKQEDLAFFDILSEYGLTYTHVASERVPTLFPNDEGSEEDRSTIHHYEVRHIYDDAGAPLDETEFDLVVQGTGVVESFVSASCARSGLKVLHVDPNPYYGGHHFSGPLFPFRKHLLEYYAESVHILVDLPEEWRGRDPPQGSWTYRGPDWSLDTIPQLHMAHGYLIDKLAESNCAKHLEFQNMDRLLMLEPVGEEGKGKGFKLSRVPLTKADVFAHCKWLSALEMRRLIKVVTLVEDKLKEAAEQAEGKEEDEGKPEASSAPPAAQGAGADAVSFIHSLREKHRLSQRTIDVITLNSLLIDDTVSEENGLQLLGTYISSVGRFQGATPFLVTQYGASEVPQNLCRVSAVWGSYFVLGRGISSISGEIDSKNRVAVHLSNKQRIYAKHVVVPRSDLTLASSESRSLPVVRVVAAVSAPLVTWADLRTHIQDEPATEEEGSRWKAWPIPAVVAALPTGNPRFPVLQLIQVGQGTQHAPKDHVLLHFSFSPSLPSTSLELQELQREMSDWILGQFFDDKVSAAVGGDKADQESSEAVPPSPGNLAPIPKSRIVFFAAFTIQEDLRVNRPKVAVTTPDHNQTASSNSNSGIVGSKIIPVQTLFPSLDDGVYCKEAERVFHIIRNPPGASGARLPFLDYMPDHPSQLNLVEQDEDATALGVEVEEPDMDA